MRYLYSLYLIHKLTTFYPFFSELIVQMINIVGPFMLPVFFSFGFSEVDPYAFTIALLQSVVMEIKCLVRIVKAFFLLQLENILGTHESLGHMRKKI
ncbi:hypothetical protein ACJX0J_011773, partial [Zea mays]